MFFDLLKKHWETMLFIMIMIGVFIYGEMRVRNIQKVLDVTIKANQEQMTDLKKNHDEEIKKRDTLIQEHEMEIKSIEDRYVQQTQKLEQEKNKKQKIIVKYYDNPDVLASKINQTWGFYYQKNE